jgi:regulatory protein
MPRTPTKTRKPPKPLNADRLRELALFYVGRFATSRGKLMHYLGRKLRERGWEGEGQGEGEAGAAIEALVADLVRLGYVDDASYAEMQAVSLSRRGYGARRVAAANQAARIAESDRARADAVTADARIDAALRFAQRKRLGPYALDMLRDPAKREKAIAAFLRAGHDVRLARRIIDLEPGAEAVDLE